MFNYISNIYITGFDSHDHKILGLPIKMSDAPEMKKDCGWWLLFSESPVVCDETSWHRLIADDLDIYLRKKTPYIIRQGSGGYQYIT